MKKNKLDSPSNVVARIVLGLACFMPIAVSGADVQAGVSVGILRTDNLFLETAPTFHETAYRVSPNVNITHESPGLDANLQYQLAWSRYADSKLTNSFGSGEASLTGKTWQDDLAVEIGARRYQVLTAPADFVSAGRLPLSSNLADRDEWYVNPRLNRALGNAIILAADYVYSQNVFQGVQVQDDTSHVGTFSLDNYTAGQGVTWALRYDWRRWEYDLSTPWENQEASAELGFWVNPRVRVFGTGGKESSWDNRFDPALEDSFWEGGVAYVGENLSAQVAAGERGFGSSWRGALDYTFQRGSTSVSYSESPATTSFDQLRGGSRGLVNPASISNFLDTPGVADRYLSKRFTWDLSLVFRRTDVTLSFFDEDRSGRLSDTGLLLGDQSQQEFRADFNWAAGVRTGFFASGSFAKREFGQTNRADFVTGRVGVSYALGTRTGLSLAYDYTEQQPTSPGPGARDYVENVIALTFTFALRDRVAQQR